MKRTAVGEPAVLIRAWALNARRVSTLHLFLLRKASAETVATILPPTAPLSFVELVRA